MRLVESERSHGDRGTRGTKNRESSDESRVDRDCVAQRESSQTSVLCPLYILITVPVLSYPAGSSSWCNGSSGWDTRRQGWGRHEHLYRGTPVWCSGGKPPRVKDWWNRVVVIVVTGYSSALRKGVPWWSRSRVSGSGL